MQWMLGKLLGSNLNKIPAVPASKHRVIGRRAWWLDPSSCWPTCTSRPSWSTGRSPFHTLRWKTTKGLSVHERVIQSKHICKQILYSPPRLPTEQLPSTNYYLRNWEQLIINNNWSLYSAFLVWDTTQSALQCIITPVTGFNINPALIVHFLNSLGEVSG